MKRLVVILTVLFFAGCTHDPVATYRTDNGEVSVQLLFTHEGYSVYRFEDGGRSHYYVTPEVPRRAGLSTMSEWSEAAGKARRTHSEDIATAPDR